MSYVPDESMQIILDFLQAECTYKERESNFTYDAKELLENVGWIFDLKPYTPYDGEEEPYRNTFVIYAYNKYTCKTEEEIEQNAFRYVGVQVNHNVWKSTVSYAIEAFMAQMSLKNDAKLIYDMEAYIDQCKYRFNKLKDEYPQLILR